MTDAWLCYIRPPRMCCWIHGKISMCRSSKAYLINVCFALKYGYENIITHA